MGRTKKNDNEQEHRILVKMSPQTLLGFQLFWIRREETKEQIMYQTRFLYDTWDGATKAAEEMAYKEADADEYYVVLNKIDDLSFSDCLSFKNTKLFILVDEREPGQEYGSVWVTPVFQETKTLS
jgi:hypothetical protein